jgi:hypothetical protein
VTLRGYLRKHIAADKLGRTPVGSVSVEALEVFTRSCAAALTAATAPRQRFGTSPNRLAAQLHAKAARGYAHQGNRAACAAQLTKAKGQCERLRDGSNYLEKERCTDAVHGRKICCAKLQPAEREARPGLAVEAWSPGHADIIRIERGIALAGQGAVNEAVEYGRRALARPCHLVSVVSRARQPDQVLTERYPSVTCTREFHEEYKRFARRAVSGS